jgi:two-component system LytT family response regulator
MITYKEKGLHHFRKPADRTEIRTDKQKFPGADNVSSFKDDILKSFQDSINNLLGLLENKNKQVTFPKIFIAEQFGFRIVDPEEIIYLESESNYTLFHMKGQEQFLATRSLCEFEKLLDPRLFLRIHKSYILNIAYLCAYSNYEGNFAILRDGTRLCISRRRLPEFRDAVTKSSVSPDGRHHNGNH